MKIPSVFYIVGARSCCSSKPGRKIGDLIKVFGRFSQLKLICGGDFREEILTSVLTSEKIMVMKGDSKKWNLFKDFLINTLSEFRDIRNDRKIYRFLCRQPKPDCVIERSARFCWAGYRYACKNQIPYVFEWKDHLLDYRYSLFKCWAKSVERRKIQHADFIFVESQVLKDILAQGGKCPLKIVDDFDVCIGPLPKTGFDKEKIFVTYNAVDPDEFVKNSEEGTKVRQEHGIAPDDLVVGYAGSYAFYHDSMRMILAAEELQKRGLSQVKWILLGSGKDYQLCRDAAEAKGLLGKNVFMIPRVPKEEVPRYLSAFDIAILPGSTDIICPIKVMEYMAAETAVMVPDYACNREVVSETCGILFTPFSEKDIADKIASLAANREKIVTLGKEARRVVSEKFVWDKTYGVALKKVLEEVIKRP